MKKILYIILLLISVNGFSQTGFPGTQSMANASTRLLVNGGLEAKRGIINGVFTDTTAANSDYIDFYNGAQIYTRSDRNFWLRDSVLNMWIRMAKFSEVGGTDTHFGNTNLTQTGNRTYAGAGFNYTFNALGNWSFDLNTGSQFNVKSSFFQKLTIDPANNVYAFGDISGEDDNAFLYLNSTPGSARMLFNIDGFETINSEVGRTRIAGRSVPAVVNNESLIDVYTDSIVLKPFNGNLYVDTLELATQDYQLFYDPTTKKVTYEEASAGGGSGTVNTGAPLKAAYYPSAGTTVDDVTGVEYNNTNLLAKFSTQATTDVGVEIKLASSQTANALNISSSGGTADLAFMSSGGELIFGGLSDAGDYDVQSGKGLYVSNVGNSENGLVIDASTTGLGTFSITGGSTNWEIGTRSGLKGVIMTSGAAYNFSFNGIGARHYLTSTGALITGSGVGFFSPDRTLHAYTSTATLNSTVYMARFEHSVFGTQAAGSGVGIEFKNTGIISSTIESIATDVTAASEDFDVVIKTMAAGSAADEKFRITSDGRLYGKALHNNSGSVTGTSNQYIASGTQTPTATNGTNVSGSTPGMEQWVRVGNVVHVTGFIQIDCSSSAVASDIDLSLPIASSFTNTTQLSGVVIEAVSGVASPGHGTISSNDTNDRVTIIFTPRADTNLNYRYTYSYQIL